MKKHLVNLKKSIVGNDKKYAIYNPHDGKDFIINKDNKIQITTIDPAVKTCAIRIAQKDFNTNKITQVKQELYDFRCPENVFATPGTTYYNKASSILDSLENEIINSHYIIIEYQGEVASMTTIRISQHMISLILTKIKNRGVKGFLIEVDPKLKTEMFKLPRMKQKELKKRTTAIALEILKKRINKNQVLVQDSEPDQVPGEDQGEEQKLIDKLERKKGKMDDIGDTICYEWMWWKILKRDKDILNFNLSRLNLN